MHWGYWLVAGLLLGLAELLSGGVVFLALAVAAVLTAGVASLEHSLIWQLVFMGGATGVLIPIAIWKIAPRFTPKGTRYGTTGSGAEKGKRYITEVRGFDKASVIRINGDKYRIRDNKTGETKLPVGIVVVFEKFDGTTAIIHKEQESE